MSAEPDAWEHRWMETARHTKGWVRTASSEVRRLSHVRFARSRSDVLLAGVAGGLGERLGIDPVLVRIAFILLAYCGAVGVLAYVIAWSVSLDPKDPHAPRPREPASQQEIAFGLLALGVVLLLRETGLWFGNAIGVPLIICAAGAGVVYVGTSRDGRPRWTRFGLGGRELATGRPSIVRMIVGVLLVASGVVWFFLTNRSSIQGIYGVLLAVGITAAGMAIVFGPWVFRLANQLGSERRDHIRSEERSELAAHLHDSVLQTLALIQRNAANPRKMASLARRQERELRSWLYGQPDATDRLETAMQAMAASVEEAHELPIEVIVVGDCPLDEHTRAVVHACREAATNAAIHSGAGEVSVYVECEKNLVEAFVRDRGKGFDPNATSNGRRGIADSIKGRIERHGGTVEINAAPGEGTEVHIEMPTLGDAS
jgi:signal transduction histidine kinase/phage shock protein PspC (stress-responsive transcriptional regulator)